MNYNQVIIDICGCMPIVLGKYNLFSSRTLDIHPLDFVWFNKLFPILINNNYGNGELALYWLLRNQGMEFDTTHANDLRLADIALEVKKYGVNKSIKIGKIPKSCLPELIELQHVLFSYNPTWLLSQLNKRLFKQILKLEDDLSNFKRLVKHICLETLKYKIGTKGYIINFRTSNAADIYNVVDITSSKENIFEHVSFSDGALYLDLVSIC